MRRDVTTVLADLITVPSACIVGLLIVMVYLSFHENGLPTGAFTLDNYRALAADSRAWNALTDTVVYAGVAVAVAMVFGVFLAWLTERTDVGWHRTINTAMIVRLLIPGFFTAMGWLFLFHPRVGAVNGWLADLFGLETGPLNVTSLVGMGVVEGLGLSALVFVLASSSLRSMDASLEETARANGATASQVFWRVTMPLIRPTLIGAGIFAAIVAVSSLDVPLILGLGNNIEVFSTYLYLQSRPVDGVRDYGVAAAFSVVMILIAAVLMWWYTRALAASSTYHVVTGRGYRPQRVRLGRRRWLARAFVVGYFLLSTVLPTLMVFWVSTQAYLRPPSLAALEFASWDNYRKLDWDLVGRGLQTTGVLMVAAPTLTILISLGFSLVVVRSRLRWRRLFDIVAFTPQAVPPLIFAFSAALVALYWTEGWYDLYGSLTLLVVVVGLVYVAFGTRMLNAGLMQIHGELDEAAATSGASSWSALRRIILPLMRPTIVYTWLWLALLSFRDLTIPTIVGSQDTVTLSVVVWGLFNASGVGPASATTMVMIALLVPLTAIFLWVAGRGRRAGVTVGQGWGT